MAAWFCGATYIYGHSDNGRLEVSGTEDGCREVEKSRHRQRRGHFRGRMLYMRSKAREPSHWFRRHRKSTTWSGGSITARNARRQAWPHRWWRVGSCTFPTRTSCYCYDIKQNKAPATTEQTAVCLLRALRARMNKSDRIMAKAKIQTDCAGCHLRRKSTATLRFAK